MNHNIEKIGQSNQSKTKGFVKKYFGEEQPIQVRFFNIVFSLGFFALIVGVIACLILGSSPYAITTAVVFALFMPSMFLFANHFNGYHERVMVISFIILDFIILPLMFLTGGGIDCGIPSYFALGIALTLFLIKGRTGIVIGILDSIWCLCIIVFSYYNPDFVIQLPSDESVFMAIASNATMVAIAVGLIAKSIFRQFRKERDAVNKLASELEEMSVKDPLTATYNRRFMMKCLQTEINTARESKKDLAIIMLDIDKFKNLNDTYGHLVGDEVLINISQILLSKCRECDIVSRYGGEEFLLIIPGVEKSTAIIRAEEIRELVETSELSQVITGNVTVSLGVGMYTQGMSCEQLIEKADKYLYMAKETGRNKVCA